MSYRATAISAIYSPKTSERFLLYIPKLLHVPFIAENVDYPSMNPNTLEMTCYGNKFTIPGRYTTGFDFNVTVPEGSLSEIELEINSLFKKQCNFTKETLDEIKRYKLFDIVLCPVSGLLPHVLGVAHDSIDTVAFGVDNAADRENVGKWKGVLEFLAKQLNNVGNVTDAVVSSGIPLPYVYKNFKYCFLKTSKSSGYTSNGITQIQKWTLTFHCHYMDSNLLEIAGDLFDNSKQGFEDSTSQNVADKIKNSTKKV